MLELLGAADIAQLAKELDLRPTKKLGQNFVIDPNTIRKIVATAKLKATDKVVEIGPGLGSLTLGILEVVNELAIIEIDPRLATRISKTISDRAPGRNCHIIQADALSVTKLPIEPNALVANLPYNISVPILLHFLETFPSITKGLVLVQAEVAARLVAGPGSKVYGAPSAKLAWFASAAVAGEISRKVFWPIPNVDSALVEFTRHQHPSLESERKAVFSVIDAAFSQRRKTLRQALASWAGSAAAAEEILIRAGISPKARGEDLAIDDYVKIARSK